MRLLYLFRVAWALGLGLTLAAPAAAQPGVRNVPAVVQTAFAERFGASAPTPTPTWDRERGGVWQAVFRSADGGAASARFDNKGQWLETTTAASAKELPADARAYVLKTYPQKRIRGAARITRADATQRWRVNVDGQRLFFDQTGHLLGAAPTRGVVAKSRRQGPRKTAAILAEPANAAPATLPATGAAPAQAER